MLPASTVESDLEVFKRACFAAENDKRALNDEIRVLKAALDTAESQRGVRASSDADSTATDELTPSIKQTPEKRIVCVIDGDETSFCVELLTKWKEGGRLAAKQLAESIHFHLTSNQLCHLWTYIYFNRHMLLDAIATEGGACEAAREMLGGFVAGFN